MQGQFVRVDVVGLTPILSALVRVEHVPEESRPVLGEVLNMAFEDTQVKTHVITGSLKASGKMEASTQGNDWSGTITYGGASAGPNNPVDYAIYEMARGGAHDFFGDAPVYEELMREAVEQVERRAE